MAATMKQMAWIVTLCGTISFVLGILAEIKKPAAGIPIPDDDGLTVRCEYSAHDTVTLGYYSVFFLGLTSMVGYHSLFYSYEGKFVPKEVLLAHTIFKGFFYAAMLLAGLAGATLLWPTVTQDFYPKNSVHHDLSYKCPTGETGHLGGGALLSLGSFLFWLVALMHANNVREDFFNEENGDNGDNGEYDIATSEAYNGGNEERNIVADLPEEVAAPAKNLSRCSPVRRRFRMSLPM